MHARTSIIHGGDPAPSVIPPLAVVAAPAAILMAAILMAALLIGALLIGIGSAVAREVRVAAAANVTEAAREIGAGFDALSGHRAVFSFASTGQLFTQIAQGAPFDVFLAADRERPARAVASGLAVAGSRFTYARGRLALYSRDDDRVTGPRTLRAGGFTRLALANPDTAPYGAAAIQVLSALDLLDGVRDRLVRGASIAQTYQFVATGNAELGFVAAAQIAGHGAGSRWMVPQTLHDPIEQDAVLLALGADNPAATAFLAYLRGPEAAAVLTRFGYGPGD